MPSPKQMEKLAFSADGRSGPASSSESIDELTPEYWEAVLSDPRLGAAAPGPAIQTRRLSETCLRYPASFRTTPAPIVRNAADGREITMARWGMPSSRQALLNATKKRAQKLEAKGTSVDFKELLRMEPDSGTTNIRNVGSAHWKRWLDPEHRCLVPFTSFSEYNTIDGKKVPVWFPDTAGLGDRRLERRRRHPRV
jgi:hypothetical protein